VRLVILGEGPSCARKLEALGRELGLANGVRMPVLLVIYAYMARAGAFVLSSLGGALKCILERWPAVALLSVQIVTWSVEILEGGSTYRRLVPRLV